MGTSYNLVWVQKDFGTTRYEDHETETRTPAEQALNNEPRFWSYGYWIIRDVKGRAYMWVQTKSSWNTLANPPAGYQIPKENLDDATAMAALIGVKGWRVLDRTNAYTPVDNQSWWRWRPFSEVVNNIHGTPDSTPSTATVALGSVLKLTGTSTETVRKTLTIDTATMFGVDGGTYEVRIRKITPDANLNTKVNKGMVMQIKSFQTDKSDYTGQCRLGMRVKATSQLSGAIRSFTALAQAKTWMWDGDEWVYAATTNPAWWFLFWCRGKKAANGTRLYGACLPDSQIDIEAIKAWAAWCDFKALQFNYYLNSDKSVADVLNMIARAGRASATWQTGKVGIVYAYKDKPHVAVFNPSNIKAGSFTVNYNSEKTADEVIVNFVNQEQDWKQDSIRCSVPQVTIPVNPVQLSIEGCTTVEQAQREGNLLAPAQH